MIFQRLRVIDDPFPRSGAWNMAIDEALCARPEEPVLRLYRWSVATVSFGYFEKIADVRRLRPGVSATRRWTGGGLVDHGGDFTYSLIIPASEALWKMSRAESYEKIHGVIQVELKRISGLNLEMTRVSTALGEGCFQRPVAGDLIWNGQKVAGAAQRRGRQFLLHQGSLQNLPVERWEAEAFAAGWSEETKFSEITPEEEARASRLVAERYSTFAWEVRC